MFLPFCLFQTSHPVDHDITWENETPLTSTAISTQTEPLSPYHSRRPDPNPAYIDDSDSNYDILPFSENEYEKLTDDGGEKALSDEDGELVYAHYPPVDSALGRSVSDENNLGKSGKSLLLKAKEEAEAAEREGKEKDGFKEYKSMRASVVNPMCGGPMSKNGDSHDVGYSSESHSNEEPDGLFSNPLHASSPKLNTRIELKLDEETPKMRNKGVEMGVGTDQKAEWRQSMTSAYDTSSNCSDLAHAHDLDNSVVPHDTSVDTVRDTNDEVNVSALTATPNHSFYCMTTIESMTDTEPSSSADKQEVNRSGATTDAECDLSRSLDNAQIEDLPYDGNFSLQVS